MARIKPLDIHDLSPSVKVTLGRHWQQYHDSLTHTKATLAYSLLSLETYLQWHPLYEEVERLLGKRTARIYGHALAQAAESPLCVAYFRKLIVQGGEQPEMLSLSKEEQGLVDFASSLVKYRGHVADHVYEAISSWCSGQTIVVLTAFSGMMVATSMLNNVLEIDIDESLAPYQCSMRYVRNVSINNQ